MIVERSITNEKAYLALRKALQDLMLLFPLGGLSCMGEAIQIEERMNLPFLAATDGRKIWYNPTRWVAASHEQRVFVLLHEWLHVFMNHCRRGGDRKWSVWNYAIDLVVNVEAAGILELSKIPYGIAPPPEEWAMIKTLTAEQIYDLLMSNSLGQYPVPGDHQDDLLPPSISNDEDNFRERFVEELSQSLIIQNQMHTHSLSQRITERLERLRKNYVPWGRLVRGQLISDMGETTSTYVPPNRRYLPRLIMPSSRGTKESRLLILVDVSASVGPTLMSAFKANVLPAAMRANETIVVTFDQVVREVVVTRQPKRVLDQVKFLTGAHAYTSAVEAFALVEKYNPRAIVCLTDGYIELPEKAYPQTIFVIPENGKAQEWGKSFTMDISW